MRQMVPVICLDLLEQYDSKATFFCLGNRLNDESAPLLKRMVELGCEIGNHSYDHTQLTNIECHREFVTR